MGTGGDGRRAEERFAQIAANRRNCVTLQEALEVCGFSESALNRRVRWGQYVRHFPAVYGVNGADDGWRTQLVAALLSAGDDAVADAWSAAALWQVPDTALPDRPQILVPGEKAPRIAGMDASAAAWLRPTDVTTVGGVPCLRTEAMVLRLANGLSGPAHERLAAELLRKKALRVHRLGELVGRAGPVRGVRRARETLRHLDPLFGRTASTKEVGALGHVLGTNLPRPSVNARRRLSTGRIAIFDLLWDRFLVVREIDSHLAHTAGPDMSRDRNRDREARADGYDVERWMWQDIEADPDAFIDDIRQAIDRAAARRTSTSQILPHSGSFREVDVDLRGPRS